MPSLFGSLGDAVAEGEDDGDEDGDEAWPPRLTRTTTSPETAEIETSRRTVRKNMSLQRALSSIKARLSLTESGEERRGIEGKIESTVYVPIRLF